MSSFFLTDIGFLRGLTKFIPEIGVADYSTLCKRIQRTEIPLEEKEGKDLVLV